ncbi:MAG: transglutaminase-like domain-containing protein [Treponema sp.]|nr:transglutaminase-like domain-containing protein [Treponema sp.]
MKNKLFLGLILLMSIFILTMYTSCVDLTGWLPEDEDDTEDPNENPILNADVILFSNFNDGTLNGWAFNGTGTASVTTAAEEESGNSYFGNDTKFIKLPAPKVYGGGKITLERNINLEGASAVTFSFKTEIHQPFGQDFKLFVNNVEKGSWNGLGAAWRTETIILGAGANNISFEVSSSKGTSVLDGLNAVYIDNISIAPDVTYSVVLYPRGKLNAYVGAPENEKIKFGAKAFRADGSLRQNAAGFVFSGPGINSNTGVLTPTAAGNITVSVSANGKTASNGVTIHSADYLRKPYTYPGTGITYNGFSGTEGTRTAGSVTVTYPSETAFEADGFFTLEGSVNNSAVYNYSYINVSKNGTTLETSYLVRDSFKQRIWLRFGPGVYTVSVRNLTSITLSAGLGAEGDYRGYSSSGSITFTVTNTRNEGISKDGITPDKRFIYPSYLAQSDDFRITNLVSDLTYGLTNDRTKIKAINDYIVMNTVYDHESYENTGMRKKQDALTVLGKRYNYDSQYPNGHFLAVCEGYVNTGSALMRAAGIEVKYISSAGMSHAWNEVFTDGGWKFLDITWNDPSVQESGAANIVDKGPGFVSYEYFLLANAPGSHTQYGSSEPNPGRSVISSQSAPWLRGAPEGWY